MASNSYAYTHFVGRAVRWILLLPKGKCSLQNRVAVVLKCVFGIQEKQLPACVWKDLQVIRSVYRRPIPEGLKWMDKADAVARTLTRKEAELVLESFLRIVDALFRS